MKSRKRPSLSKRRQSSTKGGIRKFRYTGPGRRRNPRSNNWKPGKWIKASAVRVRKVAGRVVMDIKKAI